MTDITPEELRSMEGSSRIGKIVNGLHRAADTIERLQAHIAELEEAVRLLTGASSLIRSELGAEWSDHADDIDDFLRRMQVAALRKPDKGISP